MPTAEVPVTNLYRDEILDGGALPMLLRRLHRLLPAREDERRPRRARHQARPPVRQGRDVQVRARRRRPIDELDALLDDAEDVLPAARAAATASCEMCTGDLGFTAAQKYDLEMWAPGCNEWLEVISCSNFGDFQARRANIRFRPRAEGEAGARAHAERLRAGAAARSLIAMLENYQQADGTIGAGSAAPVRRRDVTRRPPAELAASTRSASFSRSGSRSAA